MYHPTSLYALNKLYDITVMIDMHRNVELFQTIVKFMKVKFKKYWEHILSLYCIATVLDPKVKLQSVDYLLNGI